jgi:hypothetical protein
MKSRFLEGEDLCGIEIIEVVLDAADASDCEYYVMWSCNHASKATGNALLRRRWNMGQGEGSNLCKQCGADYGRHMRTLEYQQRAAERSAVGGRRCLAMDYRITPMMIRAFEIRQQTRPPLR